MLSLPSSRLIAASTVLAVGLLGVACDRGGGPAPGPTTATPTPTETEREIEPVDGQAQVDVVDTSSDPVLRSGSGTEPDQEAVDGFVGQIVTWLDRHLGDLQAGGPGDLEAVAAAGLLDGADQASRAAVTSDLTDLENPVGSAEYHIQVGHRGEPQWARVDVRVTVRDGGTRRALFTFEATGEGPQLVAAGPSHDERGAGDDGAADGGDDS